MSTKVPKTYSQAVMGRTVRDLEAKIARAGRVRLTRIKSVSGSMAANLDIDEMAYVLDDTQNFDLVVRAQDGRLYRISGATTTPSSSSGSGGTTDHGSLSGLGDDDHLQYHNDARGDARYPLRSLLTAKGDLYVRDASAINRLAIGTENQLIIPDVTSTVGMRWSNLVFNNDEIISNNDEIVTV